MATKKAKGPVVSPPSVPVLLELDGRKLQLVFTFNALKAAEIALQRAGQEVNILASFGVGRISAASLPELFFAALCTHHPEITFEEAEEWITTRNYTSIIDAVAGAYIESVRPIEGGEEATDAHPQAGPRG